MIENKNLQIYKFTNLLNEILKIKLEVKIRS